MNDMGRFIIMLLFIVTFNALMFLGGIWNFDNVADNKVSLLSSLFIVTNSNVSQPQIRDLSEGLLTEAKSVGKTEASTGSSFLGFTDAISILKSLYNFFIATITSPLQIWFNDDLDLPYIFRWIFAPALTLLYIMAGFDWLTRRD